MPSLIDAFGSGELNSDVCTTNLSLYTSCTRYYYFNLMVSFCIARGTVGSCKTLGKESAGAMLGNDQSSKPREQSSACKSNLGKTMQQVAVHEFYCWCLPSGCCAESFWGAQQSVGQNEGCLQICVPKSLQRCWLVPESRWWYLHYTGKFTVRAFRKCFVFFMDFWNNQEMLVDQYMYMYILYKERYSAIFKHMYHFNAWGRCTGLIMHLIVNLLWNFLLV